MKSFDEITSPRGFVRPLGRNARRRVRRVVGQGHLVPILPGVLVPASHEVSFADRVDALHLVAPDAVLVGAAAAKASWWPELAVAVVTATRPGSRRPCHGFAWSQATFPDELIAERNGVRWVSPALSALQLSDTLGGSAIDEALRRQACTLAELWQACALLAGRRGATRWRELLEDSRDEPWSPAERRFHRHFRGLGCRLQHKTNYRVDLDDGFAALDLAIPDLLLSFEVDGYEHHSSKNAFERDRERGSQLAGLGWQEVRFSALFVEFQGAAVRRRLRAIIAARARLFGVPPDRVLKQKWA